MKNWKKILTVVLALALLVSMTSMLSSCKDKNPDSDVVVDPEDLEAAGNGTYVISVKTAGGMPLTGLAVYVYADSSLTDTFVPSSSDSI